MIRKPRGVLLCLGCPARARTWTLLIQSQTCCQLHHGTITECKNKKKFLTTAMNSLCNLCWIDDSGKFFKRNSHPDSFECWLTYCSKQYNAILLIEYQFLDKRPARVGIFDEIDPRFQCRKQGTMPLNFKFISPFLNNSLI